MARLTLRAVPLSADMAGAVPLLVSLGGLFVLMLAGVQIITVPVGLEVAA